MRPNCVSGSAPVSRSSAFGAPHIHVLPVGVERPRNPVAARSTAAARRPPPRSFPARRTGPGSGRSHRPPSSANSSAARVARTTDESCHRAAPARRSAPSARGAGDADSASARGSTAPPPASTAAASRDRPSARLHSPGARPPASARTARRPPPLYFSRISASTRCRVAAAVAAIRRRAPRCRCLSPFAPSCRYRAIQPLRLAVAHRPSTPPPTPSVNVPAATRANTPARVNSRRTHRCPSQSATSQVVA